MTEKQLQQKANIYIKQELPDAWVYHPRDFNRAGIPDMLLCWRGYFIAIELKIPRGTVSKIQAVTLAKILSADGLAQICWSMAELKDFIAILKKREDSYDGTGIINRAENSTATTDRCKIGVERLPGSVR